VGEARGPGHLFDGDIVESMRGEQAESHLLDT